MAMPKYMVRRIERMGKLMDELVNLNTELEEWLEKEGITDYGFDYTFDWREERGYDLTDGFIEHVNKELEGRK